MADSTIDFHKPPADSMLGFDPHTHQVTLVMNGGKNWVDISKTAADVSKLQGQLDNGDYCSFDGRYTPPGELFGAAEFLVTRAECTTPQPPGRGNEAPTVYEFSDQAPSLFRGNKAGVTLFGYGGQDPAGRMALKTTLGGTYGHHDFKATR